MKKTVALCVDRLPQAMREMMLERKPEGLELIFFEQEGKEHELDRAKDAHYILCSWTPVPGWLIEAAPKLKMIQKYGIGVDKIDLAAAARNGVAVCITAGANAIAVAEMAIALMLALYRKLCVAHNALRAGRWLKWELRMDCYELSYKTVGIIGAGAIGQAVARRLNGGFECRVLYYDPARLSPAAETACGLEYSTLEKLLKEADIVSLHVPLTKGTRGLLGEREFALMKPSAILINTARGGVADEEALISALRKGTIAGAGLDVFAKEPPDPENPLLRMDNVIVSPHNGGGSVDTMKRIFRHAFDNIVRFEKKEPLSPADLIPLP